MSTLRRAAALAILALLVGALAVLAVADPFHLRYARWFTAGLVLLALLLLTAAAVVVARRGLVRVLVLVVGAVALLGWITLVGFASQFVTDSRVVSEVADGPRRLLVLEAPPSADPVYAVVLRSGSGPFEQESLVYQGVARGPAPAGVRFVDGSNVEVRMGEGCRYQSEVEGTTLAVEPVHRPLLPGSC